jgi:hypothetical protein
MSATIKEKPWVNVAVFENFSDGELVRAFLIKHRIEARIYNDRLRQFLTFLHSPRAAFRVQTRANAFRAAAEFLGGAPEAVLQGAIHCPSCGSLRVEYPQMTRKSFPPPMLLQLGIIVHMLRCQAGCENCHHTWNLPRPEKRRLRRVTVSGH